MGEYVRAFDKYGVLAGQILLTGDDLEKRRIGPLLSSLYVGIPIVNANDPVNAVEMAQYEKARDNDKLAGELAERVKARKLIMLTDQEGVLGVFNNDELIPSITSQEEYERAIEMTKSWNRWKESTGGMTSKLEVTWRFASQGRIAWIANASEKDVILRIEKGDTLGTRIQRL